MTSRDDVSPGRQIHHGKVHYWDCRLRPCLEYQEMEKTDRASFTNKKIKKIVSWCKIRYHTSPGKRGSREQAHQWWQKQVGASQEPKQLQQPFLTLHSIGRMSNPLKRVWPQSLQSMYLFQTLVSQTLKTDAGVAVKMHRALGLQLARITPPPPLLWTTSRA